MKTIFIELHSPEKEYFDILDSFDIEDDEEIRLREKPLSLGEISLENRLNNFSREKPASSSVKNLPLSLNSSEHLKRISKIKNPS